MKRVLTASLGSALVLIAAASLLAHHGRQGTYDAEKEVTLSGTLTELAWRNPHVAIYMDVKDANGKVVHWGFESANVSTMSREGWNRNTVRPGESLTITFNPSRSGAPIGVVRRVVLANGKVMKAGGNANAVN